MKFNAGFIYVAPNCDPKQQNAVIPGESIDLYVYGCSTYSQAEVVAKSLVEEKGCTAIELCAGFGNDGIARIQKVVGPDVAVGSVCWRESRFLVISVSLTLHAGRWTRSNRASIFRRNNR